MMYELSISTLATYHVRQSQSRVTGSVPLGRGNQMERSRFEFRGFNTEMSRFWDRALVLRMEMKWPPGAAIHRLREKPCVSMVAT